MIGRQVRRKEGKWVHKGNEVGQLNRLSRLDIYYDHSNKLKLNVSLNYFTNNTSSGETQQQHVQGFIKQQHTDAAIPMPNSRAPRITMVILKALNSVAPYKELISRPLIDDTMENAINRAALRR